MKSFYLTLAFALLTLALPAHLQAQTDKSRQYAEDVSSLDNILEALYASISGEKGEARDWDRFRNLFIPEARLMPSGPNAEGGIGYRIWTPDEYVERAGTSLEEINTFYFKITNLTCSIILPTLHDHKFVDVFHVDGAQEFAVLEDREKSFATLLGLAVDLR